jgi:hypothetical protein
LQKARHHRAHNTEGTFGIPEEGEEMSEENKKRPAK